MLQHSGRVHPGDGAIVYSGGIPDVCQGRKQQRVQASDGPVWFFTSSDTDLAKVLGSPHRAVAHFAAKGHDLFASIHGELAMDNDRTIIDRLWNRFVAAWFEGGQEDPKLRLLRLDAERAQIWLNENNLLAGVRLLLGGDPKKEYKDKIAEVELLSDPGGYIMSEKNRDPKIQGEGDYESARRYRKDVERFVAENDTEELAREAAPHSEQEADEMLDAEREGRLRSKVRKPEDTEKER